MNNSVGTISVDLQLDDSSFDRALTSAETKAAATGKTIDKELSGATSRTNERFATFGSIATKALGAAGIAAGIAGIASVKMAGDFQQSLSVFQSVSGATARQMELVAAKARELGQDASLPGISARDAAQALTELAKAGLDVNQSLAASKGVLSLAKAGDLDVADAATIAAEALNSFGLAGSEAARVADLLAAAANASTAGVGDIGLGLAQVGAGAKQMGVDLQDTVTALALFSNAGVQGQDAGTSLKQMFIQLATPTKQASELMRKLGLDFFDAKGNFIGLEKTSGLLQTKLKGLTQEQRNNALATIFGSDSMRVAAILADQGATGFDKMATAVNKQGAATALAAAQNNGFNGALDNFISTLQTVGTDLGTKVLPALTSFLRAVSQPAAINAFGVAIAVLGSTVIGLGIAIGAIKLGAFIKDLSLVGFAATNAGKAIASAGALIGVSFGWALVIAAAIAAVVAAIVLLQLKFNIIGKIADALRVLGFGVAALFAAMNGEGVTSKGFVGFMEHIGVALVPLRELFVDIKLGVQGFFAALKEGDVTSKGFVGLMERLGSSTKVVIGIINGTLAAALDTMKRFASDGAQAIVNGLKDMGKAFDGIKKFVDDHKKGLEQIAGVATVILGPALLKLGVTATIAGAKIALAAVDAAAVWVLNAAKVGIAWTIEFAKIVVGAIATAATNVAQAVIAGAAWLLGAAKMSAIWLFNFALMTAGAIGTAAVFVAQSIIGGFAWTAQAAAASAVWLVQFTIMSAQAIATAAVFVAQSAVAGAAWLVQAAKAAGPWLIQFGLMTAQAIATSGVFLVQSAISAAAWVASAAVAAIPWLISFGLMVAGAVATAASFVAAGVAAGIAWVAALGPIGLVIGAIAAIIAIVALVILNWSKVKDFFLGLFGAIGKAVVDFVSKAVEVGANVVAGIAKGIADGAGAVVNKIKEICSSALTAVKNFFGIHSPSTVMAEIGTNLMAGLAQGITKAGSQATDAMTGVSAGLQGALSVPSGSVSLGTTGGFGGTSRSLNQSNVFNVASGVDAQLIATELAWRSARA